MNSNDFQFALQQLSELQSFAYLEGNLVNPPFKHSKRLRLKANQPYSLSGGHQFQRCVSR